MRRAPPSAPLPPTLAVLIALALHAAVLVFVRAKSRPSPRTLVPELAATLELSLVDDGPLPGHGAAQAGLSATPTRPETAIGLPHTRPRASGNPPAPALPAAPSPAASPTGPRSSPIGTPAARTIDLGLNDGVRRAALVGDWLELPPLPGRPSDGGLRQGLAALDAERGLARSSAATHAAYEAARRFAPQTGIGVFDVATDERGLVRSVTLASTSANQSDWQRVQAALNQLLQDRRLRVPPGARGLVARLRIETGELAGDRAERFRSERAPALGQAPGHTRELRAESTRSSLQPGQLTPTLGITIAGGGSGGNIRVVLIDERAL